MPRATASPGRSRRAAPRSDADRWLGSSLSDAMRRAQFLGLVLVQFLLMAAALASRVAVPKTTVVLVAAAVAIAGVLVLALRAPALVLIVPFYLAVVFWFVVVVDPDDPLLGLLVPLTAWTVILPIMLRPGVRPVVAASALTVGFGGVILLAHPDWDRAVLSASVATNVVLVATSTLFANALRRIAGALDRQREEAADEELRAERAGALRETTAEYVRVLHDTIINTFGALARDRTRGMDPAEARERCRRDLERIRDFQRHQVGREPRFSLTDLDDEGLPVRWSGISGDDLRRFQALLPSPMLDAVYGCASEAVRNAAKHSGADHVAIDVRYADDELRIVVSDDGCGFDRAQTPLRGIASSLFARGRAHGIRVTLHSTPGAGTTVALAVPLSVPGQDPEPAGPTSAPLQTFLLRTAMAWVAQATAIGLALETIRPREGSLAAYFLLVMIVTSGAMVWTRCRGLEPAPRWLVALLLTAIPVANMCAFLAVDYGDDAPYLFQGMSLTVLPVLLHVARPSLRAFVAALVTQVLSVAVIATAATVGHPDAATEIALLAAPPFVLTIVCHIFFRLFRSIGAQIAQTRQAAERSAREAARLEAATEVQVQWSASGLRKPLELLQALADGTVSPTDPDTRRRCGDEETYLRQVSAVAQDATRMTRWFTLALAESRLREVRLHLHSPDQVRIDDARADPLGRLVLDCIAQSRPGSELVVTLLQRGADLRMLLVATGDPELADRLGSSTSRTLDLAVERFADHTLIEATMAAPAPSPRS